MTGDVCGKYDRIAGWFDSNRGRQLTEREYLEAMLARLPAGGSVLDLGCGSGEPLAGFFIRKGFSVTGVDGSPRMIALCRERFPAMSWLAGDMRGLAWAGALTRCWLGTVFFISPGRNSGPCSRCSGRT